VLLGVCLQITNGFANPYLNSFARIPEYADAFGVRHANALISISQLSETFCLLLIPFALKRLGIKWVMLIAMLCWVLRFGLFGFGNPGSGLWMFVLSMLVYGIAFDFFNISGSLFVNKETDISIRSSAQGLFFMMTNGLGATIGT
jgi:NHS family xanthosine MFS transporter